jgi:hypothetical protein
VLANGLTAAYAKLSRGLRGYATADNEPRATSVTVFNAQSCICSDKITCPKCHPLAPVLAREDARARAFDTSPRCEGARRLSATGSKRWRIGAVHTNCRALAIAHLSSSRGLFERAVTV